MPSTNTIIVYCTITMSLWKRVYFYFPLDLSYLVVNTLSRITIRSRTEICVSWTQGSEFSFQLLLLYKIFFDKELTLGCALQKITCPQILKGSNNPFVYTGLLEVFHILLSQFIR